MSIVAPELDYQKQTISHATYEYSQISYLNDIPLETSKIFNGNNQNYFSFQLTNEDGIEMNLNGQNMILTIMIYKSSEIDKLIKGAIKYFTLKS